MTELDTKRAIKNSIKSFKQGQLLEQSKALLNSLGYNSDLTLKFSGDGKKDFLKIFDEDSRFRSDVGLIDNWKKIDLIFQITTSQITKQNELFGKSSLNKALEHSYLFFAIELNDSEFTRRELAQITREVNRLTKQPALILFKYGKLLSLAIIDRRPNKREDVKNVMEKVTLIKDVNIASPHRGHIDILFELSLEYLLVNYQIASWEQLHNAWREVLDTKELNNLFYSDLQQWFYWAIKEIKLPIIPAYVTKEECTKNFVVRMLARTMFCWFLKEKGLIRDELLEIIDHRGIRFPLTSDVEDNNFLSSNSYYRGVLQNIFYHALNKPEKSSSKDFKWRKYLHKQFPYEWLISIPYLNGGVFDELKEEDNAKESIEDDVLHIPNAIFYGKGGNEGLNQIFNKYKFTIEENTPLEEIVALDPELLGHVFENLLAELDPNLEESTIKSIRKMTGAYYTPRKVIQEMVNESLQLYITKHFKRSGTITTALRSKIHSLIYKDSTDAIDNDFCVGVVEALDQCKVLDPACGSGAFPMGMLHRMVDILKIVDPDNSRWVEHKLRRVDKGYRSEFKKILTKHLDDYTRKLGIIRDSIYGVDIQPLAVQITKLRFFISLLIDQKNDKGITPMPNIETKIICANTLKEFAPDLFSGDGVTQLLDARAKYYQPDITPDKRDEIAEEIADFLSVAFPDFAKLVTGKNIKGQNKVLLKEWFEHATLSSPFFNLELFFPEVGDCGGFDIVIGNPPYGGTKIGDDIRSELGLESKDPYGAFIARFISGGEKKTPLKHGGVLAYIVSDTFMTIKSHYPLRKQIMDNYIHKMIRVHPDTFHATVNTAIIIIERNVFPRDKDKRAVPTFNEKHICQMADLTNISIHDNYEHFVEVLHQTEGVGFTESDTRKAISNNEYAIYYYPQSLIATNSNLPFFVASPKLFSLMNDSGNILKKEIQKIGNKQVEVREIFINDKSIKVVKLGNVAEVCQGLATGDNESYLFQNPEVRGNYRSIKDFKEYLLKKSDLENICSDDSLRLEIIEKGISKTNKKSNRYFSGRYILPYDKGGESNAEGGWMPNYYVPTEYFIDWSEWAVNRMKTLTTKQRNKITGEPGGDDSVASRFQNSVSYFKSGITFSSRGVYAPTFRIKATSVYDKESSSIFTTDYIDILIKLCTKISRYYFKNFVQHTISSDIDAIKDIVLTVERVNDICVNNYNNIISQQGVKERYDYPSNEQIEIDRLVYEAYGLNTEDVEEVENWYARRYPKLSKAQKENLRKLGKSDDYLVLYGLKKE
ncbi:MAG: N-6 DNA methylase [Ignavibacteriales bacterium]|nr:N-6 DNA methylase [Ignavibacteriales bacterium]